MIKRLSIFSGLLFGSGLLGMASYLVRELIAAFVLFSVGFAAVLLITLICLLVSKVAHGSALWLRIRAPQWNRARRDWMVESSHLLIEISKRAKTVHWPHLWQASTRWIPNARVFISGQTIAFEAFSMLSRGSKRVVVKTSPPTSP
jgi:ABC-type transport system involved in multi-copper enzyme maturation permease subunit